MPAKSAIYLDSNAGIPLLPAVKQALLAYLSQEGEEFPYNPSSPHSFGQKTKRVLEASRRQVLASLLSESGCRNPVWNHPSSLVFTGSGTEANQWVIRSVLEKSLAQRAPKTHWITTSAEHDSVLQMIPWARSRGVQVTVLPVNSQGQPDEKIYHEAIKDAPALVSLLYINNETGVILQNPSEPETFHGKEISVSSSISEWVHSAQQVGALVHLDAAQAWGKYPLELDILGADIVTFSSHKIGALAGSGAIWLSPRWAKGPDAFTGSLILGKAEGGRRGGTPSVIAALAMGVAAESKARAMATTQKELELLRDQFEALVRLRFGHRARINGERAKRVGTTSNITFLNTDGHGLIAALDLEGYAVSSGSACSSGTLEPSHVLLAMGLSEAEARASIRVSFSEQTLQLYRENSQWLLHFVETLDRVTTKMALSHSRDTQHGRLKHL